MIIDIIGAVLGAAVIAVMTLISLSICVKTEILKFDNSVKWYFSKDVMLILIASAVVWIISNFTYDRQLVTVFSDAVLLVFMNILTLTDLRCRRVPNKILFIMIMAYVTIIGVDIILDTMSGLELLMSSVAGAILSGAIFFICYIITRRQLGGGDVKLSFILGLYFTGGRIMGVIFYGMMCSLIYSLIQLCRKKLTLKDSIPLVPFLYIGVMITYIIA